MSSTGRATIVAGADGEALKPYYIRQRGHLALSDHALLPLTVGSIVVKAYHHRRDFLIEIYAVQAINLEDRTATLTKIASFDMGEWDNPEIADKFSAAVDAARRKSTAYHCRSPYYIKVDPPPARQ